MNILVLGATGFIGRHVTACLAARGHCVTGAVRDPGTMRRRFPGARAAAIDLNRMTDPRFWLPLLDGMDAVVNCAGILQSGTRQSAVSIHTRAPAALFEACERIGLRRIVQISAVSAEDAAGTEFARTKKAADDDLRRRDVDWVVVRPSLVYAQGSYGGTSAIRGLAALPFVIPLIGDGQQQFQPIHADDLAETVVRAVESRDLVRVTLDAVGPETLTLRDILVATRAWLDLPPARVLEVPVGAVRLLARAGDVLRLAPFNSTALAQLLHGNTADPEAFSRLSGLRPRSMNAWFREAPSHVQDRWHARSYFLRPLLTLALAAMWLGSGLAGLLNPPPDAMAIASAIGFPGALARHAPAAFSLIDIALGCALAAGVAPRIMGPLQLALVGAYTIALGIAAPELWLDPFGTLVKNLPILAAIAVWMAWREDR